MYALRTEEVVQEQRPHNSLRDGAVEKDPVGQNQKTTRKRNGREVQSVLPLRAGGQRQRESGRGKMEDGREKKEEERNKETDLGLNKS